MGFGDEEIDVEEIALGGVGVDAGEKAGYAFEGDGLDAGVVEEGDKIV